MNPQDKPKIIEQLQEISRDFETAMNDAKGRRFSLWNLRGRFNREAQEFMEGKMAVEEAILNVKAGKPELSAGKLTRLSIRHAFAAAHLRDVDSNGFRHILRDEMPLVRQNQELATRINNVLAKIGDEGDQAGVSSGSSQKAGLSGASPKAGISPVR